MMETKCFETHEIHSGILAANEEFKRRHARRRAGQEEETEFFALVAAAVISLVGAGAVLAWYRRALACAPDRACGKSAVTSLVIGFVSLGVVLTIAGYFFA